MSEVNIVSHQLPPGTILNGKYEIIRSIGEGGFGITYIGHNKVLDITVAIKEYYPKGYANRNVSQDLTVTIADNTRNAYFNQWKMKFLTEARMLAKFANLPGIVNVYDFFEQNGTAYIVMEYLNGTTLKNYVKKNGPVETTTFFKSLIPVLTSLEKIHKQGLIHRDISPDNLMLMEDGFLKLYDFGAAREYSDATQPNFSVIIKPCFAPEEQYRSKGVQGPWTDVYSVCATIYFSITGVVPEDSLQRAFSDELKKPSELGVNISPKVEATLLKGMSVRSDDRFDSVIPLVVAFGEAENKSFKKKGFGKNKTFIKSIFSMFHTAPKQPASVSALSPSYEQTEIILNTECVPNSDSTVNAISDGNIVNNDIKNTLQRIQGVEKNIASIVCPKCGAVFPNTTKFCGMCGFCFPIDFGLEANKDKISNYSAEKANSVENTVQICHKCKAVLPRNAKFCGICGTKL